MITFCVIGGFLGAGKTTLINRLLVRPGTPRLAILVNDFGDIAVDAALLENHGGDTIALKNGCVCCSIGNDLGRALGRVLDREQAVDAILVEASGVANPARIMDIARLSPELDPGGTLVVVDTGALAAQLNDRWIADTVAAQLASADLLLLNKCELAATDSLPGLRRRLDRDYPGTARVDGLDHGWELLSALAPDPGGAARDAGPHFHFSSRSLIDAGPIDLQRLQCWLARRDDVYRVKGWARRGGGDLVQLQYAGGRLTWTPLTSAGQDNTRLVFIGRAELPRADEILAAIAADRDRGRRVNR